jgi:hypothetical protein
MFRVKNKNIHYGFVDLEKIYDWLPRAIGECVLRKVPGHFPPGHFPPLDMTFPSPLIHEKLPTGFRTAFPEYVMKKYDINEMLNKHRREYI